jgi:hypothetical protein
MSPVAAIEAIILGLAVSAAPPSPTGSGDASPPAAPADRAPADPLEPTPETIAFGWLVELPDPGSPQLLAAQARMRAHAAEVRRLRFRFLDRGPELRAEGLRQIRELTRPEAFLPLLQELRESDDAVRLAVLDHLAAQGADGQGALAWSAIFDPAPAFRHEARSRMVSPPPRQVVALLERALRSRDDEIATSAAALAGALNVLEAIPLLIVAQAGPGPADEPRGDVAWIALQTQKVYIAAVQPIVGDNSGALQPIPAVLNEGVILRVVDAVAITYRTEIHVLLVSMTSRDWGRSTEHLGYDRKAWIDWYNREYVPFKRDRALIDRLSGER